MQMVLLGILGFANALWQSRQLQTARMFQSVRLHPDSLLRRLLLETGPVSRASSMTASLHARPIMHVAAFHRHHCSQSPGAGLASEPSPDECQLVWLKHCAAAV